MNWINSLLRKPPSPPTTETPAKPPATTAARGGARRVAAPAAPPADTAAMRAAAAAAADPAERARLEEALGRALGASRQAPAPGDGPAVWSAAVSHAPDKSLALAWLDQLQGDALLAQVACDGRFAEVRLAAAQRVADGATLDAIARASKNRDKGVYRHCVDLLRSRREAEERTAQALQIAQALRKLLDQAPLSVSHLLETERAWKSLAGGDAQQDPAAAGPEGDAVHALQQCRDLIAQANARILEEADAQRALHALAAGHDDLAAQMHAPQWPDPATLAAWSERRAALATALAGLPAWLGSSGSAQALGAGLQSLATRLASWQTDQERQHALETLLAGLVPGAAPDADTAAAWEALPKPEHPPLREALLARWAALSAPAAPQRPEPPAPPAPPPEPGPALAAADLDTLRAQLEQLEQALEAGQLAQADAAARLVKSTQGSHSLDGRLDARLQRAMSRLGELRGWAQWGATKKREDLIEAARQLRATVAAGTHDVEHLAVAIPALREEWKRLNTQAPAGKGQWESFDHALEAAYVPVAAFRAAEAERREQARAQREALLLQWEAALAAIDWEHPDPAAIDSQRDAMMGQWRAAAHAGYREERLLRTRFDALVRTLDERLEAARSAEIQRREALINAVAALAGMGDPRQASAEAKVLQERWRNEAGPMRLRRGEEQKLWQRFRAACDVVFARRDAERAAQIAQRQERAQARAALLERFAALVAGTGGAGDGDSDRTGEGALAGSDTHQDSAANRSAGVAGLRQAMAQFRSDWDASTAQAGESAAASSGMERQARELLQQAQQRIVQLQTAALHARYAALAQSTASPEGLEPALLDKGRAEREQILIDLEIALGLDTPGAGAQIRRQRQLEQLQNRFRAGPAAAPRDSDPEKLLARWYATAAVPDPEHGNRVATVVRTLINRQQALLARGEAEPARREPAGSRPRPAPAGRSGGPADPRTGPRARR